MIFIINKGEIYKDALNSSIEMEWFNEYDASFVYSIILCAWLSRVHDKWLPLRKMK